MKTATEFEVTVPYTAYLSIEVIADTAEEAKEFLLQSLKENDFGIKQAAESHPSKIKIRHLMQSSELQPKELYGIKRIK